MLKEVATNLFLRLHQPPEGYQQKHYVSVNGHTLQYTNSRFPRLDSHQS
jgi:hypothetical protein